MVSEADVPREDGCQPVAPQLDIDALGQLLQGGQVAGLEVVSQGHVQLLLMRLHVHFWKRGSRCCEAHTAGSGGAEGEPRILLPTPSAQRGSLLSDSRVGHRAAPAA